MATRIVHVTVKIDVDSESTGGEIAAKVIEVIDDALLHTYGGETYGWHVFRYDRKRASAISVEGARTLPMETI